MNVQFVSTRHAIEDYEYYINIISSDDEKGEEDNPYTDISKAFIDIINGSRSADFNENSNVTIYLMGDSSITTYNFTATLELLHKPGNCLIEDSSTEYYELKPRILIRP